MEELKGRVRNLTPQKWESFLSWVISDERRRRETEKAVDEAVAVSIKTNIDKGMIEGSEAATEEEARENPSSVPEWVDPAGVQEKMYFQGNVVSYGGELVRSDYPGLNRWEPAELEPGVWSKVNVEVGEEAPEAEPVVEEGEPVDDGN